MACTTRHGAVRSAAGSLAVELVHPCTAVDQRDSHNKNIAKNKVAAGSREQGAVPQSSAKGQPDFSRTLDIAPAAWRLRGSLKLDALHAALHALERRHEALRTLFRTSQRGVGTQYVRPFRPSKLKLVDIKMENLRDALRLEQTTPFNLKTIPGWRITVYRIGHEDHVLSIILHGAISDDHSLLIIYKELSLFYTVALNNQDPLSRVEPLPLQYRDLIVLQQNQEQTDDIEKGLNQSITQQLNGSSCPAEFPSDKVRPQTLSGETQVQEMSIQGSLYDNLKLFCEAREVTLAATLLTAFRATHCRLTGVADATLGTAHPNRNQQELSCIVGRLASLRCHRIVIKEHSFAELVRHVRASMEASMGSQNDPLESIVSRLPRSTDPSHAPLVQVLFAFHAKSDVYELTLEDIDTELCESPVFSKFDLEFHVHQETSKLRAKAIFSTDLFNVDTIQNLLSLFNKLLEEALVKPDLPVDSLLLAAGEDEDVTDGIDVEMATACDSPDLTLLEALRHQVVASGAKIAVKDSTSQLTYAELDEKSDRVAKWLSKQGLVAEALVGVIASRSCHEVIAFIGILKANLAYLPIDPATSLSQVKSILANLPEQKLVLLESDFQIAEDLHDVELFYISGIISMQGFDEYHVQTFPSPSSLACVMCTPSSANDFKGVMIEHRNILNMAKESDILQHMPAAAIMAHMSSPMNAVAMWEIYATLLNGGLLVCIDSKTANDDATMSHVFARDKIQAAYFTPALLRRYLYNCPEMMAGLNTVFIGGQQPDLEDFAAAHIRIPGKLIRVYGPAESASINATYSFPDWDVNVDSVPIGQTVGNSSIHVMDPGQRPVPLGVVGEFVLSGDSLGRGYTDPEQNMGRFIQIKVRGKSIRAFRTGDYGRRRTGDGQLELVAHNATRVKIQGQQVDLNELERVVRSHDHVADAVAVVHPCQNEKDSGIVTFFTIGDDQQECTDGSPNVPELQHMEIWEGCFDSKTYTTLKDMKPENIGRDFIGWTSMYDGKPIDLGEMNEWLDETVQVITNGERPGHIIEIGTGSGMILFSLMDGLQSYVGLDPSVTAVDTVTRVAASIPALQGKVTMYKAAGDDVARIHMTSSPELAVINSVAQYFPSQNYLFRIIKDLARLKDMRTIFFGDIRSLAINRQFLVSRSLPLLSDEPDINEVRRRIDIFEQTDSELLVDPGFFTALPDRLPDLIEHVEILPKNMHATNELNCYRYAAVLHVKSNATHWKRDEIHEIDLEQWIDFTEQKMCLASLSRLLRRPWASPSIALSNIPYSKTVYERSAVELLDNPKSGGNWLQVAAQKAQRASAAPVDLLALAQEVGCRVELSWARQYSQHGGLDAVFHRIEQSAPGNISRVLFRFPTDHASRPQHKLTSNPLRQQLGQNIKAKLVQSMRERFPSLPLPPVIELLDRLPLDARGNPDREALARKAESLDMGRKRR